MIDSSRLGRALGLTVGLAAGVAGVGAMAALRRPLPRTSGRLPLPGLAARAEVRRDRWGIPHIYADSNADLFAALGYVHAQDRLWQMELNRRTAHGRLAEIFGPVALSSDQFIRTLGFSRVARAEVALLDAHTREVLEAYVRGVNACLEASRGRLALEFTILGFQPRPWEVADILVWPKVMALNLSTNWTSELFNAQVVARVGASRAAEIAPHYPGEAPITVPSGFHFPAHLGDNALRLAEEAAQFTGEAGPSQGSNGWAAGPSRTGNGRPLLAEDPHLGLGIPGIWYAAHLEGGDYRAAGVACPGTCGVIIGHNERIAWGQTNAPTDVQDLYVERFHHEDPLLYEFRGEWRRAETVREEIAVKGQAEPAVVDVVITHHGPVIDSVASPERSPLARRGTTVEPLYREALALRWTALDPSPALTRSVLRINRARSWAEFRAALEDWDVPPQNFVYADDAGHFGYALGGKIPTRAKGDGLLPVPGWDGEHEWTGFIPSAALPATLDPPSGLVVTANNRIAAPDHPHHDELHGEWANPYRAERIESLLRATEAHDVRSFARIQADWRSTPGLAIARLVAAVHTDDGVERAARGILASWDGELTAESPAGTIYGAVRYHLMRAVYAELGDLLGAPGGLGAFGSVPSNIYLERALPGVLERAAAARLDAPDPWLGGRTWAEVVAEALRLAVAELRAKLGPDPARWAYGRTHTLTLRHPLGGVPALASIFNRGPWPMGGDLDTVCMQHIPRDTAAGPHYSAPSYRQIFDPGDWDAARVVLPAGQSGHPASSHYADLAAAWRAGGYLPLLWSRQAVERHTEAVLTLEPA